MGSDDYIEFTLNTFSFNTGLVGLVRLLKEADAFEGENEDFYYKQNTLYLSKSFILKNNIPELYVNTCEKLFGEDTVYSEIMKRIDSLEPLTKEYNECAQDSRASKDKQKKLNEQYKYIAEKLLRNGYSAAYQNLTDKGIQCNLPGLTAEMKASKDYSEKFRIALEIKKEMSVRSVSRLLQFKDIIYSKINMIWTNKAFLLSSSSKKDIYELYQKDFIDPLIQEMEESKKKASKCCIECGGVASQTVDLSFMIDSVEDLSRKKSVFWNQKTDAYLCPMCAFIYSLSPLGFNSFGNDLIFINNNYSVNNLVIMNGSIAADDRLQTNTQKGNIKLYERFNKAFHLESGQMEKTLNNIEVVIRSSDRNMYMFSIVSKHTVEVLRNSKKQFLKLIKVFEKVNKDYINIYQEALFNVLNRRNQYLLLDKLIRISFSKEEIIPPYYLMAILKIQVFSEGGHSMAAKRDAIDKLSGEGGILRMSLSSNSNPNALRGIIYQLVNALKLNDRDTFMDVIIRLYLGLGREVPEEFIRMLKYDDRFMDCGYAFVLGLKGISKDKDSNSPAAEKSINEAENKEGNQRIS